MGFIKFALPIAACMVLLELLTWAGVLQTALAFAQQHAAQDIPAGFDFPAEETALLKLTELGNVPGMRAHAWMVFAGLTQPTNNGKPIWTTWHYRDEVFGDQQPESEPKKFDKPTQLELGHVLETSLDTTTHALPAVNMYNEAAYRHIRENKYHLRASLQELITPQARAEIKPFPATSVVLKTFWWPVKKDQLTPLPVWDRHPLNPPEDGNGYTTFKRIVAVDPTRWDIPDDDTTDTVRFNNPTNAGEIISRPGSRVVSLERFFRFALTAGDAQEINHAINDQFKNWFEREIREGDYAVLLGFHMTTREIPEWVWATYWWHDRPTDGPFAADRPDKVTGVWRNYLMTVSYSMETPKESDGTAHIAFNPYLEGPFADGIVSNCMTCHRKAVWPIKRIANDNPLVNPFTVSRGSFPLDSPMFRGRVTTDFLWSIPLHSK